jgi:murein DD-endopeptidase MepM/ murein hydrolase activator NlpD
LLKPVVTQNIKSVNTLNAPRNPMANRSATVTPRQPLGLKKPLPKCGKRRRRTSAVMFGLAVSMGISNFSSKQIDSVAMANESEIDSTTSVQPTDHLTDRSHHEQQSKVRLAQDLSTRLHSLPVVDRTRISSWQSNSEVTIPIDVPSPRSQKFKIVPNAQAYFNPDVTGSDRFPSHRTGETNISFAWPTQGTLTSRFGRRWGRMHKGIDIAGPVGTPIQAAADGIVIKAGWHSGGYGNLIEVKHSDGTITRYGHNSRLLVSVGQVVQQGHQIAAMGSTGRSTGSHLHFEILPSGGSAVNPVALLPSNG